MISVDAVDFAVSDDTAAYSDGPDVANGFALAAQEAGADVLTDVAVTDFEVSDGSISGVVTDQGTVSTENVVLTAGPWTPRLTEKLGFDVPITLTREQILILEPGQQYEDSYDTEIPTTAPPGAEWYIRPDFGDGILVATHHSDDEVDPDHYKQNPDEDTILGLIDEIVDFVPDLEDADLQGQYCGIYSTTPDKDFVIDQAGPDGVYLGCGFSGHGFKHGPAVGKILSDLVTGGDTDLVDVGYFSLDRFEDDPAGHSDPDDAI
jgi:glycine/D-amino acid oxidase-like deaminating enzyme